MKSKYLIIGAGVHGLSTAWHLAAKLKSKNGGLKEDDVLVIDKTAVAAGASGTACGVVRNNYFQPAMRELWHIVLKFGKVTQKIVHMIQ